MSNPTLKYEHEGVNYDAEFAVIDEVHLGWEDHGVYTFHVGWKMGSSHHGTGHRMLSVRDKDTGEQKAFSLTGLQWIINLMRCLGNWDTIKGTECLALYPEGGRYGNRAAGLAPLPNRNGRVFIFDEIEEQNG